ncbi:hypothetical protein LEP1GSC173_2293 [Leptospira interrogans str. HAI1594]|uniref:Uncharacterized protein n=3 Tax=Leptospira interrogans TaxID=173 RepID=M6K1G2_LEPIR|nr:hypothetical protein G436_2812 [Leptospira interrogans serovar Hardjo str. Norma]EKP77664.1 hypothetical protein LEP1GSC173_2293 [Leptospira interrogans str. HAI1594]EMM83738.1 hypothetical protein LEP1GSC037_4095 [Leptospira interrogans str. 2006001854]EMN27956.1 hypothetical protein LEP1GSC083_5222 [Leptospira interrogans serovar Pyrogenes str. L0374]
MVKYGFAGVPTFIFYRKSSCCKTNLLHRTHVKLPNAT